MELLIDNIDDLLKYIEASASGSYAFYKPSIRIAERRFILPVLGADQYQVLKSAVDSPEGPGDDLQALLVLAQEAEANLAMGLAVSRLALTMGESGAQRTENGSQKTPYQYQETNLREAYVMAGYGAIDDMLGLLESKPEIYPAWAASSAFKDYKKYFIPSGKMFSDLFEIRQSRYTYMAIRPIMRRVEDFDVQETTSPKLFKRLKAGLISGELNEKYTALIDDYIRPAIALLTMAKAVYEKAVDISDYGVSTNLNLANNNSQQKQPATKDQSEKVQQQLEADGNRYLSKLAEILAANADEYPDYEKPASDTTGFNIINRQENSIVAV